MAVPDFGGVKKIIDNVTEISGRVEELTHTDVLVGIPKEKNTRRDSPIGNAALAYIHEFGSPAHNIPARPFLYPGLKRVRGPIIEEMHKASQAALTGEGFNVDMSMHRVGIIARNSVVKEITDPNPPFTPLKPATIRARLRRTAAGRRKLKQIKGQGKSLTQWAAETDAAGSLNVHPLIDTAQLRAAITYVVRKS
jgi:hypothetical protein